MPPNILSSPARRNLAQARHIAEAEGVGRATEIVAKRERDDHNASAAKKLLD
jgi:hypothetical protein